MIEIPDQWLATHYCEFVSGGGTAEGYFWIFIFIHVIQNQFHDNAINIGIDKIAN